MGSGQKPQPRAFVPLDGGRAGEIARTAPADLPAEQRAFWEAHAGAAIEARTLTPQTVSTWRLLCEVDARRAKLLKIIETDGETYVKAWTDSSGQEHQELKKHPLSSEYRGLAKQAEILLGRFGLAPFGKPVVDSKPRKAVTNPWSAIVTPAKANG